MFLFPLSIALLMAAQERRVCWEGRSSSLSVRNRKPWSISSASVLPEATQNFRALCASPQRHPKHRRQLCNVTEQEEEASCPSQSCLPRVCLSVDSWLQMQKELVGNRDNLCLPAFTLSPDMTWKSIRMASESSQDVQRLEQPRLGQLPMYERTRTRHVPDTGHLPLGASSSCFDYYFSKGRVGFVPEPRLYTCSTLNPVAACRVSRCSVSFPRGRSPGHPSASPQVQL